MNYVPILVEVAKAFGVDYDDLSRQRKQKDKAYRPRCAAVFMMRAYLATFDEIARKLNYSGHSSAWRAHKRASQLIEKDEDFRQIMEKIPSFQKWMQARAA